MSEQVRGRLGRTAAYGPRQAAYDLRKLRGKGVAPRLDKTRRYAPTARGMRLLVGAIALTTNRAYKEWVITFNNDSVFTSALLDRLLHHSHTVIIEGPSYRDKQRHKEP